MNNKNDRGFIEAKGVRVHNLKNINVKIPQNQLIVVTGLSGSGKSSLAFDTLYAEGQRRYVESLSSYARQFLGRMSKPEVDFIKGIPPAIAIEQKVNTKNPRSTVGTSTEIYDYLKLLFARIGDIVSPVSGAVVKRNTAEDVLEFVEKQPEGTRFLIISPIILPLGRTVEEQMQILKEQGFSRVELDGVLYKIQEVGEIKKVKQFNLVIDRLVVKHDNDTQSRIIESVNTAFYEGNNRCILRLMGEEEHEYHFSKQLEVDGMVFDEVTENTFAFNNPIGACPTCEGFGKTMGIDEDLVIPDKTRSIVEEAVACWRGETVGTWRTDLIQAASKFDFPIHRAYFDLTPEQKKVLWTGNKYFRGIDEFFKKLEEKIYKIQNRVMLARYRGKTTCLDCMGTRLKKEASYIKVGGTSIQNLVLLPIAELQLFFKDLSLDTTKKATAARLLLEIKTRIQFLCDVGLGYLTLNRLSSTLSGGESQRINLATSLGSSLVGSLYILDEPSIGLHSRDTALLITVLRNLQQQGNTVLVVEHDEEIIRQADYIIDIGPLAGRLGGEVVFEGNQAQLKKATHSLTADYLSGKNNIPIPSFRRTWNHSIEVKGACENNLKNITVKIPLNIQTVVTGVSGSGKTSLVKRILYPALKKMKGGVAEFTGQYASLGGDLGMIQEVEFVDQNPIGKSSRSNPATYLKAYDEIRKLFSEQRASKINGYSAGYFSFNTVGGRCEECQGEGTITVEMQFMADLKLTCESCKGKRFKQEILDVYYRGMNVDNVLNMTVNESIDFFGTTPSTADKRILKKLKPLQDVGLGYIKLGQPSSTLSGGESQRVKLAYFLSKETDSSTLFIFDEPTTGLHFHDINTLQKAFNALVQAGHTVLIIEHNLDIVRSSDWIIDLGPEGGNKGGELLFEGTPEDIMKCKKSYTAQALKEQKRV